MGSFGFLILHILLQWNNYRRPLYMLSIEIREDDCFPFWSQGVGNGIGCVGVCSRGEKLGPSGLTNNGHFSIIKNMLSRFELQNRIYSCF